MASARNLCQHSDIDGTQCTSNDYLLCPHCQLQLCLKHINQHQQQLKDDLYRLCDEINCVNCDISNLTFDSTNQRDYLSEQLDQWYKQQMDQLERIYLENKQQIHILCLKSHMEFDWYKTKKETQFKENLVKQLNRVLQQKQVHIDDLNEMKTKLDYIQRGLNELKQFNVDIQFTPTNFDINIIKKRYIEAAKPLFNDDDNNLWETTDDDELENSNEEQIIDESNSSALPTSSSTIIIKKSPLKLVIKRLQHPMAYKDIQSKLRTVDNSLSLLT